MIYKDDFGNTAKIEKVKLFAYRGATEKENGFRLWITTAIFFIMYQYMKRKKTH